MAFSKKPSQPPKADMSVLLKKVDEIAAKVGVTKLGAGAQALTVWKRWVGSEAEFDTKGLRDVVNANGYALDNLKDDFDSYKENQGVWNISQDTRLAAIEAQLSNAPFPG